MEPVIQALDDIRATYGTPREGFPEFLKSCQKVQLFESTLYPSICQGYILPEGVRLHEIMIQPYHDSRIMKARNSDVFVASFPKTGTTWTQEITYMILHGADTEKTNTNTLEDRIPFMEIPTVGLKGIESLSDPRLIKTHLPYELLPEDFLAKKTKIVYIARNPKDTVISFYNFLKMVGYFSFNGILGEFVDLMVTDKLIYSSFADNVLSYWNRRNDGNVLFLTYEELQREYIPGIRKIAAFLGKTLTDDQVEIIANHCSFDSMSANPMTNYSQGGSTVKASDCEISFMRKGKVGDWKNKLTEEMSKKIDEYVEKRFKGSGLEFEYEI